AMTHEASRKDEFRDWCIKRASAFCGERAGFSGGRARIWCAGTPAAPSRALLWIELLVGGVRDREQRFLGNVRRGKRVAQPAVDPINHAHVAVRVITERGLTSVLRIGTHVKRDARALLALIHEVRDRPVFARKQAPADKAVAHRL